MVSVGLCLCFLVSLRKKVVPHGLDGHVGSVPSDCYTGGRLVFLCFSFERGCQAHVVSMGLGLFSPLFPLERVVTPHGLAGRVPTFSLFFLGRAMPMDTM